MWVDDEIVIAAACGLSQPLRAENTRVGLFTPNKTTITIVSTSTRREHPCGFVHSFSSFFYRRLNLYAQRTPVWELPLNNQIFQNTARPFLQPPPWDGNLRAFSFPSREGGLYFSIFFKRGRANLMRFSKRKTKVRAQALSSRIPCINYPLPLGKFFRGTHIA